MHFLPMVQLSILAALQQLRMYLIQLVSKLSVCKTEFNVDNDKLAIFQNAQLTQSPKFIGECDGFHLRI